MKQIITEAERLQLHGLITLGRKHAKLIDDIESAINGIIEDPTNWGNKLTEAIYESDADVDDLLHESEIVVAK